MAYKKVEFGYENKEKEVVKSKSPQYLPLFKAGDKSPDFVFVENRNVILTEWLPKGKYQFSIIKWNIDGKQTLSLTMTQVTSEWGVSAEAEVDDDLDAFFD